MDFEETWTIPHKVLVSGDESEVGVVAAGVEEEFASGWFIGRKMGVLQLLLTRRW